MEAVREGLVNQGHQGELSSLLWDQVPAMLDVQQVLSAAPAEQHG